MFKIAKITNLAVGLFILFGFVSSAYATESSGVGAKPANPRDDNPRTQSIFVHEISPGKSVEDAIIVSNSSDSARNILLYPTDAQISSGGAFACEQKADNLDNEGSWIKLKKEKLELSSNQSETIGFKIEVPNDASPGEHNACIAIQAVEPPQQSQVSGVTLSFRSAIRVAITVPGEFTKGLTFESLSVKNKGDLLLINEKLRNSGNVSLDTNLQTKLKTLFGTTVNSTGGEFPILAGQTSEFNFELKKPFIGGAYLISSSASYSDDPTTSLGEKGNSSKTVSKSKLIFVAPNPLMIVIYILLLAILVFISYKIISKRKYDKEIKGKIIEHKVKKKDSITSISKEYEADWKTIAKINKLKAPYILEGLEVINVVPGSNYIPKVVKKTKKKVSPKSDKKPKAKKSDSKKTKKKSTVTKESSKEEKDKQ